MGSASKIPDYASNFLKFNDSVYFHKLDASSSTATLVNPSSGPSPDLILVLGWAGARLRDVTKYTAQYSKLFPSTPQLLVLTEFRHILFHTRTSQDEALKPAIALLRQYTLHHASDNSGQADVKQPSQPAPPKRLLVHIFSNGGSYKLMEIARRYQDSTPEKRSFRPEILIVDSAPGNPSTVRSVRAMMYAIPLKSFLSRLFVRPTAYVILYVAISIMRLVARLTGRQHIITTARHLMNEPKLIDPAGKRCYIFSPQDELVGLEDVRSHAAEARTKGYDTREEMFDGSKHVAHARLDPERYWGVVVELWRRAVGAESGKKIRSESESDEVGKIEDGSPGHILEAAVAT